jgi:hypothetical protein
VIDYPGRATDTSGSAPPRGRLLLGSVIFLSAQLAPLLIPLVSISGLSKGYKTALTGILLLGIPELGILVSVVILGKPGFNYLKGRIFGFLGRYAPPDEVGPTRYRVGLAMFMLPILLGWLAPYGGYLLPGYRMNPYAYGIAGDLMLLVSLFVLGGDFWDKLRSIFVHGAKAVFPSNNSADNPG